MDRNRGGSVLAAALTVSVVLSGCGADPQAKVPFTQKQVTVYDTFDTNKTELTCLYRDDMPNIPFVNVEQYLDLVYCEDADYTLTGDGSLYSVTGQNKDTGKTGSRLLIDTEKDTMTFEGGYGFVVGKPDGTTLDCVRMTDVSASEEPTQLYDLSRYEIDLVARDGQVYMPLSTLSDILNKSLTCAETIDGKIILKRDGDFGSGSTATIEELENSYYETTTRESDVAAYAYRELCFVLENLYGRPEKALAQEFVNSLSTRGLNETLEQGGSIGDVDLKLMKEYLTSTDKAEYAQGLFLLDNLLYDGGHNFFGDSFYATLRDDDTWDKTAFAREYRDKFGADSEINVALSNLGRRYVGMNKRRNQLAELRDEGFGMPEKVWVGNEGVSIAALYLFDRTAVFLFDHFTNDIIRTNSGEKPFQEALDLASENGCEYFLLDLSTNGGGSDQIMGYILSMIYGHDAPFYHLDANTGYQKEDDFSADKNLDGSIDELDEAIRYDFRYGIMISDYSYSCGNAMPNLAHLEGIPLFGCATSGGGCNVSMLALPGECATYSLSSTAIITDSSYRSVDKGIEPDTPMLTITEDGIEDASLYDPDQLIRALDQYY